MINNNNKSENANHENGNENERGEVEDEQLNFNESHPDLFWPESEFQNEDYNNYFQYNQEEEQNGYESLDSLLEVPQQEGNHFLNLII